MCSGVNISQLTNIKDCGMSMDHGKEHGAPSLKRQPNSIEFMANKNVQEQRRKQIVEALHRRLLLTPYDQTTIKDIAAEAGVNHGVLHYYFRAKEDILLAYIDHVIDLNKTAYATWYEANRERFTRPADFMWAALSFMSEQITFNRDLSRIFIEIWEIGNYNPKVREKLRHSYREWIAVVQESMLGQAGDAETVKLLSILTVAVSEGLSMLSVMLDPSEFPVDALIGLIKNMLHASGMLTPTKEAT